jgi:hypothetical protein
MSLSPSQKKFALWVSLLVLVVVAVALVGWRWNSLRSRRAILPSGISTGLSQIKMAWPLLSKDKYSETYALRCAVSDIFFNSEISGDGTGRFVTPELESMLDIVCSYLDANGNRQNLLIPMAFVRTINGEPQSFYWSGAAADFRFFPNNPREFLIEKLGLKLGDVMSVNFNMTPRMGYGYSTDELIMPEIAKITNQATIDEFAQTGNADIFNENFLPLEVGIGVPDPYPKNINLE